MAKILELDLENEERLCALGSALSSPARIQILKLLYHNSFNVAEIAEKLQIPTSSAAVYIRSLETAGLINTKMQKGSRGSMKICSRKYDNINITLTADDESILDAALRQGADLPYACKGGVCATCKCKVLRGKVDMATNYSLEPDELAAGYVLSCQALPLTADVIVDFDAKGMA